MCGITRREPKKYPNIDKQLLVAPNPIEDRLRKIAWDDVLVKDDQKIL